MILDALLSDLAFGWRSAILLGAIAPTLAIALALPLGLKNRTANLVLTALLLVLAGIALPWMIGFAGFYDKWRVLSFVPFAMPLAVMPLMWLYTLSLTRGRLPERWWLHLAPAAIFALMKVSEAWLGYVEAVSVLHDLLLASGLLFYGRRAWLDLKAYRIEIADIRSNDAIFAAHWLTRALISVCLLFFIILLHKLYSLYRPLGYEGLMGLHILIAYTALYLAVEGWRHASLPFAIVAAESPAPSPRAGQDWRAMGQGFAAATRAGGYAGDPDLSLARLAQSLGTNTSYLSRALNEGLGLSFSAFINGLRCETVAEALLEAPEANLLDLALDAGFSSKATFNRAFQARFGMSPSAFRLATPQIVKKAALS